jgi:hypothetical protein
MSVGFLMLVTLGRMAGHSRLGRRGRVVAARRQARIAQGRDPDTVDLFDTPPKPRPRAPKKPTPPVVADRRSESVGVLSLGEAAARLGMTRAQLEVMIDAGKVEALPTGFTRMVPTREVARLTRRQDQT